MTSETSPQLYNLSALEPLIEAGKTLLSPNYRLARRIKAEWDRQQIDRGLTAWQPLTVYPLQQWFEIQWQQAVELGQVEAQVILNPLQLKELWRQVIDTDRQEHDQYGLLQSSAAVDMAQQARESLLRWQVDWRNPSVQAEFKLDTDCSTFLRWLQRFEQVLEQKSLLSEADYLQRLLQAELTPSENVVLVDFDDLPPLHHALLNHLAGELSTVTGGSGNAEVMVTSYPEHTVELQAMAQWTAKCHKEQAQHTIGLILTDMQSDRAVLEYHLRQAFDCLGANYTSLPVNFSTAITLDQAPVIRDALLQLSVVNDSLARNDVSALLRSRFSRMSDQSSGRAVKLISDLYREGGHQVDIGRLRSSSQAVCTDSAKGLELGEILMAVANLRIGRIKQPPSAWVSTFFQLLDEWGWPGNGALDSLEFQQVEQFYKLLEQYAGFDALFDSIGFQTALALLRRCCQDQVSQPKTKDSPIQVLGPLEAAGLHFDQIWVCGLQANRWPAPASPNAFIPVSIQRQLSMPHASSEREWAYAEHLLNHYRAACGSLQASYARQIDGIPELPSPLLQDFTVTHCDSPFELSGEWLQQQQTAQLQQGEDRIAPAVDVDELKSLSRGSGVLQAQANCGFRAFASQRLHLEALGDQHTGLSAADRGTVLHNALYVLWGDLGDSASLHKLDESARHLLIQKAAKTAVEEVPSKLRELVGMACLELEEQRLISVLHEWLDLELARDAFTVSAREEPKALSVGALSFNLRIDRIDTLATGETLVIDYKSGRNSLADWLGERPAQPQLPLYAMATAVDAVAFAQVKSRDCKFLGLGEVEGVSGVQADIEKAVKRYSPSTSWDQLKQEWELSLQRLADAFIAGDAAVDPLPNACTYCGLESVCRVELSSQVPS